MNLKKYTSTFVLLVALSTVAQNHSTLSHAQHKQGDTSEEADFAEREQEVMPFDLNATLHIFEDTATGGVQRVVANYRNNVKNIALIRSHLAKEASAFARGEFTDPSYLHGATMPGLADLQVAASSGLLEVTYSDLEDGGQIAYRSDEPSVIIALHLWFQAQVTDHKDHATN